MSTDWLPDDPVDPVLSLAAPGFPPVRHPAEADLFCRQASMPGHRQEALEAAHVVVVGCGGLGSWIALALARMGTRHLTLVDPDHFDRTNVPRQFVMPADIGKPKAHALGANLVPHMTNRGSIEALAWALAEALDQLGESVQAVVVGVDNNAARLEAAQWARQRQVPSVFAMLSADGLRSQVFWQDSNGPCLSCVLPNLETTSAAPCAAASMASCYLTAAHAVMMLVSAISKNTLAPSWRETSLDGTTERVSRPLQRAGCPLCA